MANHRVHAIVGPQGFVDRRYDDVMGDRGSEEMNTRALSVRPVLTAWSLVIGVDLFFNAGVFMSVFDQGREPNLLPDELLFRRIPVAYVALLVGVAFLAWIIDALEIGESLWGAAAGGVTGSVYSLMGSVFLWTAVDMTGLFVAVGSLVVITEFASAGWVLSAFRIRPNAASLTRRFLLIALLAAVAGIVIQNLGA